MSGIAALRILSVLLAVTGTLIVTATASAHPHILPKVKTNLVFSPDGHVTAIQHTWLYDSAYSTFVGRDIDVNKDGITSKDELVAFGRKQIDALAEHSYFTTVTTQAGDRKSVV